MIQTMAYLTVQPLVLAPSTDCCHHFVPVTLHCCPLQAGSSAAVRFNQALSSMSAAASSLIPLATSLRPALFTPSNPFAFYGQAVQNKTYVSSS